MNYVVVFTCNFICSRKVIFLLFIGNKESVSVINRVLFLEGGWGGVGVCVKLTSMKGPLGINQVNKSNALCLQTQSVTSSGSVHHLTVGRSSRAESREHQTAGEG